MQQRNASRTLWRHATVCRNLWTRDQPVASTATYTQNNTNAEYTRMDIRALNRIRTHDPSVRASQDSSCLTLRRHWDQHQGVYTLLKGDFNSSRWPHCFILLFGSILYSLSVGICKYTCNIVISFLLIGYIGDVSDYSNIIKYVWILADVQEALRPSRDALVEYWTAWVLVIRTFACAWVCVLAWSGVWFVVIAKYDTEDWGYATDILNNIHQCGRVEDVMEKVRVYSTRKSQIVDMDQLLQRQRSEIKANCLLDTAIADHAQSIQFFRCREFQTGILWTSYNSHQMYFHWTSECLAVQTKAAYDSVIHNHTDSN
jgi:hypothetical protein